MPGPGPRPITAVPLEPVPLADACERLRSGDLTPAGHVQELLERARRVDPVLHALVDEPDRSGRVVSSVAALAHSAGPLHGIAAGVKDVIRVDGIPTTAGSRLEPALFAGPEASVVTRLRQAGAVVLAKTVTAEFAFVDPGPTRNPHHLGHTPGGSSSGSAAGVAAGLFPLALGTQTIGSVIRPAAFCGVVGFKPTFGRIPTDGVIACSPSADTVGLFTQDSEGVALAAAVLCDDWRAVHPADPPTLGVPEGPYLQCAARDGLDAFAAALAALSSAGMRVVSSPCMQDYEAVARRHRRMVLCEMAVVHEAWFASYAGLYGPRLAAAIREGQTVPARELESARAGRSALRDELHGDMERHEVDVWVSPAASGPAPYGLSSTGDSIMNLPWTHAGLPTITIPAGRVGGLPVGLQCAARFGDDERLLAWAGILAAALDAHAPAPSTK